MKISDILFEEAPASAEQPTEQVDPELVRTKRGHIVWYEQGDGLRKYAIAKVNQDGNVVDVTSAVTSRNAIKNLYSRRQAKRIVEIIKKEHPECEPRIIKASMEKYNDGSVSINVG